MDLDGGARVCCALYFDRGIKLSDKVIFITLNQLIEELPADKAQTKDSNMI